MDEAAVYALADEMQSILNVIFARVLKYRGCGPSTLEITAKDLEGLLGHSMASFRLMNVLLR
jgi:hypothetical protein